VFGLGSVFGSKGLLDGFVVTEPMNFGEHTTETNLGCQKKLKRRGQFPPTFEHSAFEHFAELTALAVAHASQKTGSASALSSFGLVGSFGHTFSAKAQAYMECLVLSRVG
jgi:hypothetical protein